MPERLPVGLASLLAPAVGVSVSAGDLSQPVSVPLLVNGEARSVPVGCSVAGLLRSLGLDARRLAVAVNRDVVPRSRFSAHGLVAGDRVEILEAVGGG
jgi:sulfur carrier protein